MHWLLFWSTIFFHPPSPPPTKIKVKKSVGDVSLSLSPPPACVWWGRQRGGDIISVNSVVETVGQVDLVTKPLQLWSGHVVYSCHLQSSAWMDISGWEESKHGRSSFMSTTWQIFLQISPKWDLPYSISTGSSTAHSHHVWKAHRCIWSTRECGFFVVLFYFFLIRHVKNMQGAIIFMSK